MARMSRRILDVHDLFMNVQVAFKPETHSLLILSLVPDMARMGLRRLISSIVAAWHQIWPEWASGGSF